MRCPLPASLFLLALACQPAVPPVVASASQPELVDATVGQLTVKVPRAWRSIAVKSPMRKAQWALPGPTGANDADLTVYFFGAQAGTLEANLDRWKKQFEQVPPDNAKTTTIPGKGGPITVLEVSGTYVAEKVPGSGDRLHENDWSLLAAVVGTTEGALYFKLVGPAPTVAKWKSAFLTMF